MTWWPWALVVFVVGSWAVMAVQMHRSNWDNDPEWNCPDELEERVGVLPLVNLPDGFEPRSASVGGVPIVEAES